jgi:hypothetical protein
MPLRITEYVPNRGELLTPPSQPQPSPQIEEATRSGCDILRSALIYCEWRAARGRHGQLTAAERFSSERLWYLGGVSCITDLLYGIHDDPGGGGGLDEAQPYDPRLPFLARSRVALLVNGIMALCPQLTDRKLLTHLTRAKLAGMLVRAMEARPDFNLPRFWGKTLGTA